MNLTLKLANKTVSTTNPAFVMGIVNANHNSFRNKSRGGSSLAFRHIKDGADIIDIGAESSRPGASYISAKDEIKALVPIIEKIRKVSDIPISIDTRKKEVMKAAFESGANILNDISALEDDKDMARYAASINIPVILMHKRGNPDIMQKNVKYENVFSDVNNYLLSRITYALDSGIKSDKIIIDPGIGFAKNLNANMILIKKANALCDGKYPLLMALSRKTCIGELTGKPVKDRLYGTLTANIYSVLNGAFMVRVHDVAETVDAMKVLKGILNAGL